MKGKGFFKELYKNRALYSMFLPAAAVLILFNYLPMFGMVTAFRILTLQTEYSEAPGFHR